MAAEEEAASAAASSSSTPLSDQEFRRLCELERVIEAGIGHFVAVGEALAEVQASKLYRALYGTFVAYCWGRWKLGKSHAYRLIEAAEVVADVRAGTTAGQAAAGKMSPMWGQNSPPPRQPSLLPQNELQTRVLAKADPEQRSPIWHAAVDLAGGQQPSASRLDYLIGKVRAGRTPEQILEAVRRGEEEIKEAGARELARQDAEEAEWRAAGARWHLRRARRQLELRGGCEEAMKAIEEADRLVVEACGEVEPRAS